MNNAEYNAAANLYFTFCAGCHGVDRRGSAGNALTDWTMRVRGSQSLMQIMHFGTSWGMPNWGTGEQLSEEQLSLLARFLQQPAPEPPLYGQSEMQASWQNIVPIEKRPKKRLFPLPAKELFVSLQHDTGEVLLIDAKTKRVLAAIETGLAPHEVDISKDGRYLYVIARGGQLAMIDLFMAQPSVVARVRVGLEARSVAVGRTRRPSRLVAGTYWPGDYVILNATTLEPLHNHKPEDRVGRLLADRRPAAFARFSAGEPTGSRGLPAQSRASDRRATEPGFHTAQIEPARRLGEFRQTFTS